jgi:hypothetical protein
VPQSSAIENLGASAKRSQQTQEEEEDGDWMNVF